MAITQGTAAVWSGVDKGFSIDAQPLPTLRPGEVLVRTELATVCGSDLHTINGDRPTPLPTVLGHEAIGHVVTTGGGATAADGSPVAEGYGHEAIDDHWLFNGGFGDHVHLVAGTGLVRLAADLPAGGGHPRELRDRHGGLRGTTGGPDR
ncbi:MAG: alcohol dehydrogenase catalytic domain-containing protein [Streptosporangiales bacterium]|nr:alcohol dehydrogenase catalytic domain-containing protein [Streptosporangiales bacterium]